MNEQENVRIMKEAYDAFGQGDIPKVFSTL